MARKPKSESGSWKVGTVNSGADLDAPFFPQPDAAQAPRSKGGSSHEAFESFMRGGK